MFHQLGISIESISFLLEHISQVAGAAFFCHHAKGRLYVVGLKHKSCARPTGGGFDRCGNLGANYANYHSVSNFKSEEGDGYVHFS